MNKTYARNVGSKNAPAAGYQYTIFDEIAANEAPPPSRRGRPKSLPISKTGPGRKLTADELAIEKERYAAEGYNKGKQKGKILDRIRELTKDHKKAPWRKFALWMAESAVAGIGWDPTVEDYLRCHTSQKRLAFEYFKSIPTIKRHIADMVKCGILARDHMPVSGGRTYIRTMPKYVFTLGVLHELNDPAKANCEMSEVRGASTSVAELNDPHTSLDRKPYGNMEKPAANRVEQLAKESGCRLGSNEQVDEVLEWLSEKNIWRRHVVKMATEEPWAVREYLNNNWSLPGKLLADKLEAWLREDQRTYNV